MVLILSNSIQDYFEFKTIYNFTYPSHYNPCNVQASHCLYYSTEYDPDYDDDDDFYEFAEAIQNDRTEFFSS